MKPRDACPPPPSPTVPPPAPPAAGQGARKLPAWLWPRAPSVDSREILRAVVGAALGILCMALGSRWAMQALGGAYWLAAPLGASAVILFVLPSSPLAQPWPVIGGNTLCTVAGVACGMLAADPALTAAAAVALAIALMFALRCLHPPGAAAALLAALGQAEWSAALLPVLVNSVLLVAAAIAYNRLTGRPYPQAAGRAAAGPPPRGGLDPQDLDAALARYNHVLDVSREDLAALLHHVQAAAYARTFGHLRCRDIMSARPAAVPPDMTQQAAWALMRARRVKALPVVDPHGKLLGIVTAADFLPHDGAPAGGGWGAGLRALWRKGARRPWAAPRVGQAMTRQVDTAWPDQPVSSLVPLFAERGHRHIPIVRQDGVLTGIVTQSDLVRALHRTTQQAAGQASRPTAQG
ncbi:HPP family protein [Orrella sp. JC864]|uniref:HPP family protein n=1 Tax=Orrella sp. JC864 TaxID=3120298 RepID=UPI00300B9D2D